MGRMQKVSITTGSWVKLAIVALLVYALFQVWGFILVLITSIVIASAIEPGTRGLIRHSIPRLVSVIIIYVGTAATLSLVFYFLLLPLIGEVSGFINTLTIYSNAVANDSVLSDVFRTQELFGGLDTPRVMTELGEYLKTFSQFISQGIFSTAAAIFGGVVSFVLIIVLSFYLAVQDDGVGKFLRIIVPSDYEEYALRLWRRSQLKIGYWMEGQLILGVMVALLVYVTLLIVGVPHALLLAVLAGIFVAYGSLGMTTALVIAGIYLLIQQLENHILYPMVVKKVVGVPPIVSIIAIVIGGQLAGFLGILVAVPVAVVAMEFLSDYEERKIAKLSELK